MKFQIIMIVLTVLTSLGCPIAIGVFAPSLAGGITVAAIGAAWLIGCIAANSISALRFRRKILRTPAEAHKNRAVENAAKIRLDPIAAQKNIRKRLMLGTLYSVSLLIAELLLSAGICMLIRVSILAEPKPLGMLDSLAILFAVSAVLYMIFAFPAATTLFFMRPQTVRRAPAAQLISDREYPALCAVAQRAAKAVGCPKKHLLIRNMESDAISVSESEHVVSVQLPPVLCALLTEEELYQVLLHEFAHVVHEDTKWSEKLYLAENRYSEDGRIFLRRLRNLFYRSVDREMSDAISSYRTAASLSQEQAADDAVIRIGNPQAHVDALAKSMLADRCYFLNAHKINYEIFESETPITDYYSRRIALFEHEAHALYETEQEIMLRTLPARNDTHPTFSMRMRANGVTEPNPFRTEADGAYRKDAIAFLKDCDDLRSKWEGWETARADYLETKQRIEAYEAKTERGEFPDELETKTYLYDTYRIAPEKALNAAEKLLEADGENLTASCVLGLLLCKRDDERGIRLICKTAKKSTAAIDLVEAAGDTVLRTGQQKLLDEFRADQVEILQNAINEARSGLRAGKFKPGYFCACDLPEARVTAIRRVVTRLLCGNAEKAYLVKYAAPSGKPLYAIMIKPQKPVMQEYKDAIGKLQDYIYGISDYTHRYILLPQKLNGSLLSAAERVGIPLLE